MLKPVYFAFVESMSEFFFFFFANYTFCTLVPEVRSRNTYDEINVLTVDIKSSFSSALRASLTSSPRSISIDNKKISSGTQGTHVVKLRAHSPRPTSKIISMIALRRANFDEGNPCGEPPCKSLVQRSRMPMQKRPLFIISSFNRKP